MPDTETTTTDPVFFAAEWRIRDGGKEYVHRWSEAMYPGGTGPEPNIASGEVPRRVLDGFVYGECVFLPADPDDEDEDVPDVHIERMLRLDATQRRTSLSTRSIPVELEDDIIRLSATLRPRGIVAWLLRERRFETSFGAVDRLIRRRKREARLAALDTELRQDFQAARVDYRETAELMLELQHELVERMADKTARDELVPTLRTCHQTVSVLERRLRHAKRDFVNLNGPTPPRSEPAPGVEHPSAPTGSPVESKATNPASSRAARSARRPGPGSRAWAAAILFLVSGWLAHHGLAPRADAISALNGLYAPVGAVLANPKPAVFAPVGDSIAPVGDSIAPVGDSIAPVGDSIAPVGSSTSPEPRTQRSPSAGGAK